MDARTVRHAILRRTAHALCALALMAAGGAASAQVLEPPVIALDGTVSGHVFDAATGEPIAGVTVTLIAPPAAAGEAERVEVSDGSGAYEFAAVAPGSYGVRFTKSGYQGGRLTDLAVQAGQPNPADFALAAASAAGGGVEEIVITATARAPEASRPDADQLINVMDAAEIGKFAASDVGDAIRRISGVNVVEGQFAIIRGLEDRYSSTLYNSAPVPSPDPDSQSVQLDLFPSEVATNLVIAKTFSPDLPSNSSGGSINVITHEYAEDFELKLSFGSGFNSSATERFLGWHEGTPMGGEERGDSATEGEAGGLIGARTTLLERELSFRAVVSWERDFGSKQGALETREPRRAQTRLFPQPAVTVVSGDLSLGQLNLSGGRFDYTESDRVEQLTGSIDLGLDLDREGDHPIRFAVFYTKKDEEIVQLRENGYLPTVDYGTLAALQANGQPIDRTVDYDGFATLGSWVRRVRPTASDPIDRGPLWFASVAESRAFERGRDLQIYQLNGEHRFDALEGVALRWAANRARTSQDEGFFSARYFYEPDDKAQMPAQFPSTPGSLGGGEFASNGGIFFSTNEIDETQDFLRFDAEYERALTDWLLARVSAGVWWEDAGREVGSSYLETPLLNGAAQFGFAAASPALLGRAIATGLDQSATGFTGLSETESEATREVLAGYLNLKATLFEQLDVLAGVRQEAIRIESRNDPFTGSPSFDGSPGIFPSKYLMFDRLDNAATRELLGPLAAGASWNDQLLGIDVPVDPATGLVDLLDRASLEALVNGEIDETRTLPSAALNWHPLAGLNLRAAWSQTVARPSLREIGYYVSVEPGSDDLVVGNPQLKLSDVESWDLRAEYAWGDLGELVALSLFLKHIERPIESIVVRDAMNFEGVDGLYRTFFNNPNQAELRGVEIEGRKALDFLGVDALQYLSLAANFTYIDAEVDRPEIELERSAAFYGVAAGDVAAFAGQEKSRRLFSQPEWIANADLTFDHPDWGTRVTLACFAISDVLDAAGSAAFNRLGEVGALNLDRYVDSYYQLDLVVSQRWSFERLPGALVVKGSLKNLTDSRRRLIYDSERTVGEIAEREFQVGRDLSVSVSYEHTF